MTESEMRAFIKTLGMPQEVEARLLQLSPSTYTGYARELAEDICK